MVAQPASDWVVAVHSGPASHENLMTVLVAWARWRDLNPHSFSLWYESTGRVLVLRGFDERSVADFLSYARSQSTPPLISGPPSQRLLSPPLPATASQPAPKPAPSPPPPPVDSSPLLQGVLQVITERETGVRPAENRLMEMLGTTTLVETDVLWVLFLSLGGPLPPDLVALASTPSLREEGVKLYGVAPEKLAAVMLAPRQERPASELPDTSGDETSLHIDALRRGMEGRTAYWAGVMSRLKAPVQGPARMTAAVVVDEVDGKITWVFPRSSSPAIRAISSCILYSYENSIRNGQDHVSTLASTASFASRLAGVIGINLRWYVTTAGKQGELPVLQGVADEQDVALLRALLARYGGALSLFPEKAPEPIPQKVPTALSPEVAKPRAKPASRPSPGKGRKLPAKR